MTAKCAWCLHRPADTVDHLVPKCLGGTRAADNIVYACQRCNAERGRICDAHARITKIQAQLDAAPPRWAAWWPATAVYHRPYLFHARRLRQDLPRLLALQEHWVAVERLRLGTTYSDCMVLALPQDKRLQELQLCSTANFKQTG